MMSDFIVVKGAREHNLKNIDVKIPRDKLVVITGVSGSGKSSLAFDTIYAEGQRRYVESLSAYARQFLGRMEKPDVDYIEGLSPAISIDQKGVSHNPRSTVGTVTEVYDYLRLLFARVGRPHCPKCGRPVERQTVQQVVDAVLSLPQNTRFMVMAPMVKDMKGEYKEVFEDARKKGFARVRVDGKVSELTEEFSLDKFKRHSIEIVVDRLAITSTIEKTRIADSVETALKMAKGIVLINVVDESAAKAAKPGSQPKQDDRLYSEHFACVYCNISLPEIEPRTFSFNNPHGACPECTGLGHKLNVDPDLVIPNRGLSLAEGAILPWQRTGPATGWYMGELESFAKEAGIPLNKPVKDLSKDQLHMVLFGETGKDEPEEMLQQAGPKNRGRWGRHRRHHHWNRGFEGVIPNLERRYKGTESDYIRQEIERYMTATPCEACDGKRLKPESLAVTISDKNIVDICDMSITAAVEWARSLSGALAGSNGKSAKSAPQLSQRELMISDQILKEINSRLKFLVDIGLDYLTVSRTASTLSGGEAQRIRLATQIGSGLMGVLYVCDEPSVGLHPADDYRLIQTLKRLRDLGNTIIVVEHDEAIMRQSDWIVDLGPGAGEYGGRIVAEGTIDDILRSETSLTGAYLSGRKTIPLPKERRKGNGKSLVIKGAKENNLKNIDVVIPLGKLVTITGVSGSGKSTLIADILYKRLAQHFYRAKDRPGKHTDIKGLEHLDKIINVDQSPIGRTPRSNPATYTGAFTSIREMFASVPDARARGYEAGRFSFNVKGGRCETCSGAGYIEIEMQFMPNVTVPCEVCEGKRYNREALDIMFKGKNISDVLNMTVDEAYNFFENIPKVRSKLETMRDVGLGYIRLGQPATTMSGGEAQRIKLSTELSKRSTGMTLYILDEPTTGLSFEDAAALLKVLQRLVDAGNSIVLIEHHLDLIKCSDWLIDLGPGAGDKGGKIVAEGTPEHVANVAGSFTGQYLRPLLHMDKVTSENGKPKKPVLAGKR
ncbi:MAG: excinuclease ABC subunit UvrA [Dehalococcoidia bacterium]|nr:excinuclease ABC subunit UvrA [Dehalococcoidia bacterium]